MTRSPEFTPEIIERDTPENKVEKHPNRRKNGILSRLKKNKARTALVVGAIFLTACDQAQGNETTIVEPFVITEETTSSYVASNDERYSTDSTDALQRIRLKQIVHLGTQMKVKKMIISSQKEMQQEAQIAYFNSPNKVN